MRSNIMIKLTWLVNLSSKEKYLESKNYDKGNKNKVAKLPYGKLV